jgi:hypothetical protein
VCQLPVLFHVEQYQGCAAKSGGGGDVAHERLWLAGKSATALHWLISGDQLEIMRLAYFLSHH